jgi:hypothetical protein
MMSIIGCMSLPSDNLVRGAGHDAARNEATMRHLALIHNPLEHASLAIQTALDLEQL